MFLDYKYNDRTDPNRFYYRSDHYNFAKNGIPSVFLFTGVHADYHQAADDVDRIEFDALTKRTQLAFAIVWELAEQGKSSRGGQKRKLTVFKKPISALMLLDKHLIFISSQFL